MKTTRREDGWWITDVPPGIEECGPYATKREADEDRWGIERFVKNNPELIDEAAKGRHAG